MVLGVIIATLVLIINFGYAGTELNNKKSEMQLKTEQLAADIMSSMDEEYTEDETYKVFNNSDQLIYQTQNVKDKKLIQLLKTSDFIAEVDKITYYKLSR